ncbi:MAG: hypothetical protein KAT46_08060 [Deltaproteobacteria bacterium]|nr:hypothetical protein [Deltaproteobacteria bacterium]
MAKTVAALKALVKDEEKILKKLAEIIRLIKHPSSLSTLKKIRDSKKKLLGTYKQIIKDSEKCPAVKKKTGGCKSRKKAA